MDIGEAQKNMRQSYLGGGSGVLASGLIWITAGIVAFYLTKQTSILIFFLGGMLIHPLGIVISKLFKRSGQHQKNNPLAKLAMESTVILFIGLFIAYSIFQIKPDWFFPIMLMMIGVRYLLFQSIYGMKIFWLFGLILIFLGGASLTLNQTFQIPAILGGMTELVFAIIIILSERKSPKIKSE